MIGAQCLAAFPPYQGTGFLYKKSCSPSIQDIRTKGHVQVIDEGIVDQKGCSRHLGDAESQQDGTYFNQSPVH
jgi:hypothetical protein